MSAIKAQVAEPTPDPWLARAQTLTDDLVKDSASLTSYDRALLWARLGSVWRQDNAERARRWNLKAVEEVESASMQESRDQRRRRLDTARLVFSIIGTADKSLSMRLAKVFDTKAEGGEDAGANADNAKAMAEAALGVLDADPQKAAKLGSAALRAGGTYKLAGLLWRLRKRDAKLGDALFEEILEAARQKYDVSLLSLLPTVAFEGPAPSDRLRGSLLLVIADGLLRAPGAALEEAEVCKLAPLAAPLLPQFQQLLSERAAAVRLAIAYCQPHLPESSRREVADSLGDRQLNTIDDLLKAAGDTDDSEKRVTYLSRAAYAAAGQGEFERAVNILDSFTIRDREWMDKLMKGVWEGWRLQFAASAATAHLERGDWESVRRVILAAPQSLRAFLQIHVGGEALKKGDRSAALALLGEGRAGLTKADLTQAADGYLSLLHDYVKLAPVEAVGVLREAVAAMNRAGQTQESDAAPFDTAAPTPLLSNDILLARYSVPAALLEIDESGSRQTIASLSSPPGRVAINLHLLKSSLKNRRDSSAKSKTPEGKRHAEQ
ncbi:MAG TPA: hypothetical protein VM934_05625 [Pyrinomonadaceae bacterium]|nr:hypothetical protein [Pyrinomonadaceae bacterium]